MSTSLSVCLFGYGNEPFIIVPFPVRFRSPTDQEQAQIFGSRALYLSTSLLVVMASANKRSSFNWRSLLTKQTAEAINMDTHDYSKT